MDGPFSGGNASLTACDVNEECDALLRISYAECVLSGRCLGDDTRLGAVALAPDGLAKCYSGQCLCNHEFFKSGESCLEPTALTNLGAALHILSCLAAVAVLAYGLYPLLVLRWYGALRIKAAEVTCLYACTALVGLVASGVHQVILHGLPSNGSVLEASVPTGVTGVFAIFTLMQLTMTWVDVAGRSDFLGKSFVSALWSSRPAITAVALLWVVLMATLLATGNAAAAVVVSIFFALGLCAVLLIGSSGVYFLFQDVRPVGVKETMRFYFSAMLAAHRFTVFSRVPTTPPPGVEPGVDVGTGDGVVVDVGTGDGTGDVVVDAGTGDGASTEAGSSIETGSVTPSVRTTATKLSLTSSFGKLSLTGSFGARSSGHSAVAQGRLNSVWSGSQANINAQTKREREARGHLQHSISLSTVVALEEARFDSFAWRVLMCSHRLGSLLLLFAFSAVGLIVSAGPFTSKAPDAPDGEFGEFGVDRAVTSEELRTRGAVFRWSLLVAQLALIGAMLVVFWFFRKSYVERIRHVIKRHRLRTGKTTLATEYPESHMLESHSAISHKMYEDDDEASDTDFVSIERRSLPTMADIDEHSVAEPGVASPVKPRPNQVDLRPKKSRKQSQGGTSFVQGTQRPPNITQLL